MKVFFQSFFTVLVLKGLFFNVSQAIEYKPKVAILGAGLSGLSAAYLLNSYEYFDIQIFEAGIKSGGRIRSTKSIGNAFRDEGGSFIDSEHLEIRALVHNLGLELVKVIDEGETIYHQYINQTKSISRDNFSRFKDTLVKLSHDYEKLLAHDQKTIAMLENTSIENYLRSIYAECELIALIERMFQNEYGADLIEMKADELFLVIDIKIGEELFNLGGKLGDEAFTIKGGNHLLTNELEKLLQVPIKYDHEIVAIEQNNDKVLITFKNAQPKQCLEFDYVLTTFAPEILKNIRITPLPSHLQNFFNKRHSGDNLKIFLYFNNPCWRKLECGNRFNYLTDRFAIWDNKDDLLGYNVFSLVAMAGGKEARKAFNESEEILEKELLDSLSALMPEIRTFHIGTAKGHNWSMDRYFLGAYAGIIAPGQEREQEALLMPYSGRIYFAGSAFDQKYEGFMEGALRSSKKAISLLIISYKSSDRT